MHVSVLVHTQSWRILQKRDALKGTKRGRHTVMNSSSNACPEMVGRRLQRLEICLSKSWSLGTFPVLVESGVCMCVCERERVCV